MKKAIILLFVSTFAFLWTLWFSQALTLPQGREIITEKAFTKWYNRIPNEDKQAKVTTLNQRLILAKKAYVSDTEVIKFLSYIQSLTAEFYQIRTSTVSVAQSEIPVVSASNGTSEDIININFSDRYDWEKIYLWWERKKLLSKIELIAQNEPIELNEITIFSSADRDNHIEKLYVYDEKWVLLGSRTPSWRETTIKGVRYLLEQWTTDIYIAADLLPIWTWSREWRALSFSTSLSIEEARGYFSGSKISMKWLERSDLITISPIIINEIELLNSYNWYLVDERIVQWENTLMIFKIHSEVWNNKLSSKIDPEILLEQLRVSISDWTANKSVAQELSIERIDRSSSIENWIVSWDTVTFTFTNEDLSLIEDDDEAIYRIYSNISLDSTKNSENVRISIIDLKSWWLQYREATSSQLIKVYWGENTFRITGKRIVE